jgi:hypothetical protein
MVVRYSWYRRGSDMKYSVGDWVICNVEIFKDGKKKLSILAPGKDSQIETQFFPIVAIDRNLELYKIIIADELVGWMIGKFHIEYQHVDKKFYGRKFYDIPESLILGKEK